MKKFKSASDLISHLQKLFGAKTPRRIAAFIVDYLFVEGYARFYYDKNLNAAGIILDDIPCIYWERAREVALERFREWAYDGEGARPSAASAVAGMLKAGTITKEEFNNFINAFDDYNKQELTVYKIPVNYSFDSEEFRRIQDAVLSNDDELGASEPDCQGS